MLKNLAYYLIIILLIVGVVGSGSLVWDEVETGNGCPKVWIIPACVIVLICFLVPLITHLLKKYNKIYFAFTGLAFFIAVIASIMQFTGNGECPKLDSGIPMCYLSFLIFLSLILLKLFLLKQLNKANRL